ncbi:MAG: transcriptional regulator [Thaumarchaeota archaeon]|nr:MAG: transcriptional regulator [Nitrososphaerota archaeon]
MKKKQSHLRKERRSKLDIYFDILYAIQQEQTKEGVKPTIIQYKSGMSYDKITKHLAALQEKKLVSKKQYYHITEKGHIFLTEYSMIKEFVEKMDL